PLPPDPPPFPTRRSSDLTADPPHETKRGRVGRLGERVRAIRELARHGVVSADKSLRHPAESLLELVRAVHRVVLSSDIGRNPAEDRKSTRLNSSHVAISY